jgi:hypothetical protein
MRQFLEIKEKINEIDKLDNKFINPKFKNSTEKFSKKIKICIIYKDLKKLFNFDENDQKILIIIFP